MIFLLVGVVLLGLIVLWWSTKNSLAMQYLQKIEPYLRKELHFNDQIIFLNLVRTFNLYLVEQSHQQKLSPPVKRFTNDLLGLILKIPRMAETSPQNLLSAIKQIQDIADVSTEIKQLFLKKLPLLKKDKFF